jgi:hypothetical protein
MKRKTENKIKKILQKINCILLFIILECQFINLSIWILNNCITIIK